MLTRISLVRHGVTEWNYAGRIQGRSDIPLAPEGERQAEAAAQRLAAEPWDAVYSSPLQRAYQTALIISRRVGQHQVMTDPRLAERNMGEAEGLFDLDLPILWPGRTWDEIPGMEPPDRVAARAQEALTEIASRHAGGQVICVAHGSLIRAFLRSLLPPAEQRPVLTHLRTASITRVRHDGRHFVQEGPPDHRHSLQDGIEYSGEKGRISHEDLIPLLPERMAGTSPLEALVWGATAIESAWTEERMVGFGRAFTDGALFGCIDFAAVLPGYEQARPVLIERLRRRYPMISLSLLPDRELGPG